MPGGLFMNIARLISLSGGTLAALALGALGAAACSATVTPLTVDFDGGDDAGLLGTPEDAGNSTTDASKVEPPADAGKAACDPDTDEGCVSCGGKSCEAPLACCYEGTTATCGTCASTATSKVGCDGPEDCTGGQKCCVQAKASASSTGTSACATTCAPTNGSTGTASLVTSVACHSSSDCAGVKGQFGVPYPDCCKAPGLDVGVCLSQTYSSAFVDDYGGSCN